MIAWLALAATAADLPAWLAQTGPARVELQSIGVGLGFAADPGGTWLAVGHGNGLSILDAATLEDRAFLRPGEGSFFVVDWTDEAMDVRDLEEGWWLLDWTTGQARVRTPSGFGSEGLQDADFRVRWYSYSSRPGSDERPANVAFRGEGEPIGIDARGALKAADHEPVLGPYAALASEPGAPTFVAVRADGVVEVRDRELALVRTLDAPVPEADRAFVTEQIDDVVYLLLTDGGLVRIDLASDAVLRRPGLGRLGIVRAQLRPGGGAWVVTADEELWTIEPGGGTRLVRERVTDAIRLSPDELLTVDPNGWAHHLGPDGRWAPWGCLRDHCTTPGPYPQVPDGGPDDAWRLAVARFVDGVVGDPERLRLGLVDGHLVVAEVDVEQWRRGRDWSQQVTVFAGGRPTARFRYDRPAWVRFGSEHVVIDDVHYRVPDLEPVGADPAVVVGDRRLAVEVRPHPSDRYGLALLDTVRVGRLRRGRFEPDTSFPPLLRPQRLRFTEADVLGDRFLHYRRLSEHERSGPYGGLRIWRLRPDGQTRGVGVVAGPPPPLPDEEPEEPERREPPLIRRPGLVSGGLAPGPLAGLGSDGPALLIVRDGDWGELPALRAIDPDLAVYVYAPGKERPEGTLDFDFGPVRPYFPLNVMGDAIVVDRGVVVWAGFLRELAPVLRAMQTTAPLVPADDATVALEARLAPLAETIAAQAAEVEILRLAQAARDALAAGRFDDAREHLRALTARDPQRTSDLRQALALLGQPFDPAYLASPGETEAPATTVVIDAHAAFREEVLPVIERLNALADERSDLSVVVARPQLRDDPRLARARARQVRPTTEAGAGFLRQNMVDALIVVDGEVRWIGAPADVEEALTSSR